MAGAKDFMVDPQSTGFGPPNMAAQLYSMISGLPDAYRQGVEQKFKRGQMSRTEELQKPILDPTTGLPTSDFNQLSAELLKRGGTEYASSLIPYLWKTQQAAGETQPQAWDQPAGPQAPRTGEGAQPNQSSNMLRQGAGMPPRPGSQPQLSSAGTDLRGQEQGQDTVRGLAIERGIDVDTPGFKEAFAGLGPNGLDRELKPQQAAGVIRQFANLRRAGMFGPEDATAPSTSQFGPTPVQTGRPAPTAPQAAGGGPGNVYAQAPGAAGAEPGASLVPPGWLQGAGARTGYAPTAQGFADYALARARRLSTIGDAEGARVWQSRAQPILESLKATDPAQLAFERAKGIQTHRTEDAFKRYAAVEKAGSQAEDLHPQIAMARSLVNSPGFNAGIGKPFTDTLQAIGSTLLGDPSIATPGQFFDKLRAGSILNEIRSLGGSGAGPVRVAEMKFIDSMYAGRDMQPASIRAVVEVENRLTQRTKTLYNMAQNYVQKHGILDEGFNREVSAFKERPGNAMFSKAELANPGLLSMPVFATPQEMAASRMPRGTKFRNPDGEVGTIP